MNSFRWPSALSHLSRAVNKPSTFPNAQRFLYTTTPTRTTQSTSFLRSYRLALGLALPTAAIAYPLFTPSSALQCASDRTYATGPATGVGPAAASPPPPESIINLKEMGFGTVAGIAVGVFVKKGLKAAAFLLGGVFVLMQYFSSRSLISINWSALTNSYDSFITKRAGANTSNRAAGLWYSFVDFVSADVQGRATFVAGLLLGLRIG